MRFESKFIAGLHPLFIGSAEWEFMVPSCANLKCKSISKARGWTLFLNLLQFYGASFFLLYSSSPKGGLQRLAPNARNCLDSEISTNV